jgi:hypothetical protein
VSVNEQEERSSSYLPQSRSEEDVQGAAGAALAGIAPGHLPQRRLLLFENFWS